MPRIYNKHVYAQVHMRAHTHTHAQKYSHNILFSFYGLSRVVSVSSFFLLVEILLSTRTDYLRYVLKNSFEEKMLPNNITSQHAPIVSLTKYLKTLSILINRNICVFLNLKHHRS